MSNVEATLWGAVIGGGIGFISAYAASVLTAKFHMFNVSAQKLRDAFTSIRVKVNDPRITDTAELEAFFFAEFYKQQLAITDFHFVLRAKNIPAFEKAWHQYYEWEDCQKAPNEPCFVQYTMPKHDGGVSFKSRQLANERIDAILAFTRFKFIQWL